MSRTIGLGVKSKEMTLEQAQEKIKALELENSKLQEAHKEAMVKLNEKIEAEKKPTK